MRKTVAFLMCFLLLTGAAACGKASEPETPKETESSVDAETADSRQETPETVNEQETENEPETGEEQEAAQTTGGDSRILIAYFSVPEDVDTAGADAISGASIVVRDGEVIGNTEYVARIVKETIGGDLFSIETVQQYPLDHDPLVDQAAEEQSEDARPELATHIENPDDYDTIILGYPNWWGDLPQPLYTFLEEYDFSGKTIIPFVTHGGSGFSNTRNTISELQPNAVVSDNTLSLSRNDVAESEEAIRQWAESL